MQRREAIQFLREIGSFPEVTPFSCVHLRARSKTASNQLEDVELHVKTNCDMLTRQVVERLALGHQLRVKEEPNGFLVVYSPKRTVLEITA